MIGAVAMGVAVGTAATRLDRSPGVIGSVAGAAVLSPAAGVVAGSAVVLVRAIRRLTAARRTGPSGEEDLVLLADLTTLGLAAGLPLAAALRRAADEVGGQPGDEVHRVLRAAGRVGLAPALVGATGLTGRLLRLAARASATGAPLSAAVSAYAAEVRHAAHSARLAAARKLPVRLLLPLALLVLPGFVILIVGPVLLDSLARLGPIP